MKNGESCCYLKNGFVTKIVSFFAIIFMTKNVKELKCFCCGQLHSIDMDDPKKNINCTGCGAKISPVIFDNICEKDMKGFYVILGFFAINALLGGMGGVMLVNGWNFWVTFCMIGVIMYFIGKIFVAKYKITEMNITTHEKTELTDAEPPDSTKFDRLVVDAVQELPQNIKSRLSNVSIVVEDKPSPFLVNKLRLRSNRVLLGVFQGIPMNKKSVWHAGTLPEKITLFQKNIEAICHSEEEMKQRIKKVVRHEVAHYVGFTEEEIRILGY